MEENRTRLPAWISNVEGMLVYADDVMLMKLRHRKNIILILKGKLIATKTSTMK